MNGEEARFDESSKECFLMLKEMFGHQIVSHMVVVVNKWPRDPRSQKRRAIQGLTQ